MSRTMLCKSLWLTFVKFSIFRYRVLCNTWPDPDDNLNLKHTFTAKKQIAVIDMFAHSIHDRLIYVHQLYNEYNQDSYYKLKVEQNPEDHANFKSKFYF